MPAIPLLNESQAASLLGIKPETLQRWRSDRRYDLPYVKVGRTVRYRPEDVDHWLTRNTVGATVETQTV